MNTVNRVQLTGNLGKKPEIKTFENGGKVASFSVATNEEYTTKTGEKATDTQHGEKNMQLQYTPDCCVGWIGVSVVCG